LLETLRSVVAIFKKMTFAELVKHFSHFMEREDSLVCTENTAAALYPKPDESSPKYHTF
jgi:hypothetical protein